MKEEIYYPHILQVLILKLREVQKPTRVHTAQECWGRALHPGRLFPSLCSSGSVELQLLLCWEIGGQRQDGAFACKLNNDDDDDDDGDDDDDSSNAG